MAGNAGEAVLDIRTNSGTFHADVDKAERKALGLGKSFQQIAKEAERFGNVSAQLGNAFRNLTAAFTVGSLITRGVEGLARWGLEAVQSAGATVDLANKL